MGEIAIKYDYVDIIIRKVKPEEATGLSDLAMRSKAFWGYSAKFMEACRKELSILPSDIESGKYYYAVAERRGQVVGYCAVDRLSCVEFELEALFVEPKHIHSGVGRTLMNHAKNYASTNGGCVLTIQGDPNAERFYQAAGGKLTGKRESASIPGRFLPIFEILLIDE